MTMTKAQAREMLEKAMQDFHMNAGVVKQVKPRKRPKRGYTVGHRPVRGDGPRYVKER